MSAHRSTVLVTGASGQLGQCLQEIAPRATALDWIFADRTTLDICEPAQIEAILRDRNIGVVVNTAAWTKVEEAETQGAQAWRVNVDAPESLAGICARRGVFLVHISTDMVFDGRQRSPYLEDDLAHPLSNYGRSKLAGEIAIRMSGVRGWIIRTSWLYSKYGGNFVKIMLKVGRERESLRVVDDQMGTPTHAADLAEDLVRMLAPRTPRIERIGDVETYHYTGMGQTSWCGFARKIFEVAGWDIPVEAISTREYPSKVMRAPYNVLNCSKIDTDFGLARPAWETALSTCLAQMDTVRSKSS